MTQNEIMLNNVKLMIRQTEFEMSPLKMKLKMYKEVKKRLEKKVK